MKILYLSTFDIEGGAARGAYRLHRGFVDNGIDSTLFVAHKVSGDPSVKKLRLRNNLWWKLCVNLSSRITSWQKTCNPIIHSINFFTTGAGSIINKFNPDIVQLHWIGKDFISIPEVSRIKAPIVWRLADQWAFCGAEHYVLPGQDYRYRQGYLKNNRPPGHFGFDIDRWTWNRKMRYWRDKPQTIITGSRWLANCAKESVLFADKRIEVIPSGIDISIFKPVDKHFARHVLNIPQHKKLVLFGAIAATSDPRKGFDLLTSALRMLSNQPESKDFEALVFGSRKPSDAPDMGIPVHYIPHIKDEICLSLIYSAADVLVAPSTQDNLPFTVMEAQACGRPCVAFNIGGLPDMIDHKINGYLAEPFEPEDLAAGIATILTDDSLAESWGDAARKKAEQEYDVNIQVKRYLKIYQEILDEHD